MTITENNYYVYCYVDFNR